MPLGVGEWPEKKKRHAACFSLHLTAIHEQWRAKSAMHYPAITGAIYIPPSITDTYYSPPAVQRLPHNFLKAAPYILIQQQLLCKCKTGTQCWGDGGKPTSSFLWQNTSDEPQEPKSSGQRDRDTIQRLLHLSVTDLKAKRENDSIFNSILTPRVMNKNIFCLRFLVICRTRA